MFICHGKDRQPTFGVLMIKTGHLGFLIGCPDLAAFWILPISTSAQSKEALKSASTSFKSSTKRGW